MPSATTTAPIVAMGAPALTGAPDKKRKIICFSDFDGTIFMQDTGHVLFDHFGCGSKKREVLDEQIHSGERSFRDVSEEMWGSLNVPFDDGFEVMGEKLDMDPEFRAFHRFCRDNDIPFNVISAGLKPVLRRVLDTFLGEEESSHIDIVANDAAINPDGSEWRVLWRHDTDLGHDKALSLREARAAAEADLAGDDGTVPLVVFIGDGVSDLPAARHADVLFARRGLRLEAHCRENGIAHTPFDTFADVRRGLEAVRAEDARRTAGAGLPARFNPRANPWRRASGSGVEGGGLGGPSLAAFLFPAAAARYVALSPSREERMFLWPEAFTELVAKTAAAAAATPAELDGPAGEASRGPTTPAVVVPAA